MIRRVRASINNNKYIHTRMQIHIIYYNYMYYYSSEDRSRTVRQMSAVLFRSQEETLVTESDSTQGTDNKRIGSQ